MANQHERRVGQANPSPRALEQRDARLALEHRELLRDGRGGEPVGALICLASAVAFGAMAIFGKLSYDEGATVATLLAVRFLLAATLFWALVAGTGAARRLRTLARRDVAVALALGAVGYNAQPGAYFAALQRLDASLLSLLL